MFVYFDRYLQATNGPCKTLIAYFILFTWLKSSPSLKTIDAMPSI